FQAEDGIRDATVTGVQTCALPISGERPHLDVEIEVARGRLRLLVRLLAGGAGHGALDEVAAVIDVAAHRHLQGSVRRALGAQRRSEERRVGKEWRGRWVREPRQER